MVDSGLTFPTAGNIPPTDAFNMNSTRSQIDSLEKCHAIIIIIFIICMIYSSGPRVDLLGERIM